MAPVSACPMLLVLLILLGPLPASTQTYQNFQRQHMDYPKTSPHLSYGAYCNLMMQRRGMTNPVCKDFNTFIHEPQNAVDVICPKGGTCATGNLFDSLASFTLTNCELTGGSHGSNCKYKGFGEYRHIEVACNNGLPVHFQKRI